MQVHDSGRGDPRAHVVQIDLRVIPQATLKRPAAVIVLHLRLYSVGYQIESTPATMESRQNGSDPVCVERLDLPVVLHNVSLVDHPGFLLSSSNFLALSAAEWDL